MRARAKILTVHTIAESGLPDYEIVNWHGFLVPAGTPPPIVAARRSMNGRAQWAG